ncbi:MAG: methylated-DNA--[protein]-cysteine S-methyltransferase [Acidimicrobiales bacterium]
MSSIEARLRAFETDLRPPRLPAGDVAYAVHDSAIGRLVLAVARSGTVLACSYDSEETVTGRLARAVSPRVVRDAIRCDSLRRQLDEYLSGRRREFDLAVDLVLVTPFARRVLEALCRVPYGATSDYGTIARAIGSPGAARAVGSALGSNPVCVLLPCHRILRGDGTLGGYAGGTAAKQLLLYTEQHLR